MMESIDFDIRFSEYDDISYVASWLSMPGGCDEFPFTDNEKDDSLKTWLGYAKFKASLTGVINDVPCAVGTLFLMPYKKVAHHASFYLIVDPEKRRKGIGTSMVKNLLNLAKNRFRLESLHAEIFLPSLIEGVLKECKFKEFARQDDFVKIDPTHTRPRLLLEHSFT